MEDLIIQEVDFLTGARKSDERRRKEEHEQLRKVEEESARINAVALARADAVLANQKEVQAAKALRSSFKLPAELEAAKQKALQEADYELTLSTQGLGDDIPEKEEKKRALVPVSSRRKQPPASPVSRQPLLPRLSPEVQVPSILLLITIYGHITLDSTPIGSVPASDLTDRSNPPYGGRRPKEPPLCSRESMQRAPCGAAPDESGR